VVLIKSDLFWGQHGLTSQKTFVQLHKLLPKARIIDEARKLQGMFSVWAATVPSISESD
jgi:hypothetical protein